MAQLPFRFSKSYYIDNAAPNLVSPAAAVDDNNGESSGSGSASCFRLPRLSSFSSFPSPHGEDGSNTIIGVADTPNTPKKAMVGSHWPFSRAMPSPRKLDFSSVPSPEDSSCELFEIQLNPPKLSSYGSAQVKSDSEINANKGEDWSDEIKSNSLRGDVSYSSSGVGGKDVQVDFLEIKHVPLGTVKDDGMPFDPKNSNGIGVMLAKWRKIAVRSVRVKRSFATFRSLERYRKKKSSESNPVACEEKFWDKPILKGRKCRDFSF